MHMQQPKFIRLVTVSVEKISVVFFCHCFYQSRLIQIIYVKKRKVDTEGEIFQEQWSASYLFSFLYNEH